MSMERQAAVTAAAEAQNPAAEHDVPAPAPLDMDSVLAGKAMEQLRLTATESVVLAGTYATTGRRTVRALRTSLVRLAADYDTAYDSHARVVPASATPVPDRRAWRHILVTVGVGAGAALFAEAAVPDGVTAGWRILAEAAAEAVECGVVAGPFPAAGKGTGVDDPAADLDDLDDPAADPGGVAARGLADLYRAVVAVRRHADHLPLLLAGAEHVLIQFRRLDAGVAADLSRPAAVELAARLGRCTGQLGQLNVELRARQEPLRRLDFHASAPRPTRAGLERQIWIVWLSQLGDATTGVPDQVEARLHEIGVLGPGGLAAGAGGDPTPGASPLAAARRRAAAIRARHAALTGH
ncbi:MAG TPA: hypothetical protein VFR67_00790 [Pilimelia sp.]|nr:hypothetical protein [Pilimelia sp.]